MYLCAMLRSLTQRGQRLALRCLSRTFLLFVLLAAGLASSAQQKPDRLEYQLLWRITGPKTAAPSYLFGTMHLADKRVFEFSDSVLTALKNAKSFAMEVDLDSLMSFLLSPEGFMQETPNEMRKILSEDEYHFVDSLVLLKTGVPIEKLKMKSLWFIEKLLTDSEEAILGEDESGDTASSNRKESAFLDAWFHQKATRMGKPVHSLEQLKNQTQLLMNDGNFEKDHFLWDIGYWGDGPDGDGGRESMKSLKKNYLLKLVDLYYRGNPDEIIKDFNKSGADFSMIPRNREMADNLAAMLNKGSVFAAVGVAHLPGKLGMVELLRKKGFTVEAVPASFTGVAARERLTLDSLKGYPLNRLTDGYSVTLPGSPSTFPIPNMNRKMYIGTGTTGEVGFAFSIDIPQLTRDENQIVKGLIDGMARQGNATIEKSYPVTYRNMQGVEAVMSQAMIRFYLRIFMQNNRALIFMHAAQESDEQGRNDFFESVRFYDIIRQASVYETVNRPDFGVSVMLPSDANQVKAGLETERPEEIYSALDKLNQITYIFRIIKTKRGYYNTSDATIIHNLRVLVASQDSTARLIDSAVVTYAGLPRHEFTFRHGSGFISKLHYVARGNLAYSLLCTYDEKKTDSLLPGRFLHSLQVLPIGSRNVSVPFTSKDGSFTLLGPEKFVGGDITEGSKIEERMYSAMDSTNYSMYYIEQCKFDRYFERAPDSLAKYLVKINDTTFKETSRRIYTDGKLKVYEAELKSDKNGLHWYRKSVLAGHTLFSINLIAPNELAKTDYARTFLASFRPTAKALQDTQSVTSPKIPLLMTDLQSRDTALFNQANAYLVNYDVDSADVPLVLQTLDKPFPLDTGKVNAKLMLLASLPNSVGNVIIPHAEKLYDKVPDVDQRKTVLRVLSLLRTDEGMQSFLKLAAKLPEDIHNDRQSISSQLEGDSIIIRYLPDLIDLAAKSDVFLQEFVAHSYYDSIWLAPKFAEYELQKLVPGIERNLKRLADDWKKKKNDDEYLTWNTNLFRSAYVLAAPGIKHNAQQSYREMMAGKDASMRALAARGLMYSGVKLADKDLKAIIEDPESGYGFINKLNDQGNEKMIRHLLSQETIAKAYVSSYYSEDWTVKECKFISRHTVKRNNETESMLLFHLHLDDEWKYVLIGPFSPVATKLTYEPHQFYEVEKEIAEDKVKLSEEAQRLYTAYFEEEETAETE